MTYRFEDLPLVRNDGKTKVLRRSGPFTLDILEKNDMTAGNGKRHELVPGKGQICAVVTREMFELARRRGVPHALIDQVAPGVTRMHEVRMRPYEVVGRFVASGSFCKRHPHVAPGSVLRNNMAIEFYLKTKGKVFGGIHLPDDDPLILRKSREGIDVVHPGLAHGSVEQQASLVHIPASVIYAVGDYSEFLRMEAKARLVGLAVRDGWGSVRCRLIDFKVEFGMSADGQLLLADSLSPDEMRVMTEDGRLICKEPFRQGASVEEMVELYVEALVRVLQM